MPAIASVHGMVYLGMKGLRTMTNNSLLNLSVRATGEAVVCIAPTWQGGSTTRRNGTRHDGVGTKHRTATDGRRWEARRDVLILVGPGGAESSWDKLSHVQPSHAVASRKAASHNLFSGGHGALVRPPAPLSVGCLTPPPPDSADKLNLERVTTRSWLDVQLDCTSFLFQL